MDKPLIQFQPSRDSDGADGVLEMEWKEANHSGIQNIIIVTGRGKTAIEDHFDVSFELADTRSQGQERFAGDRARSLGHAQCRLCPSGSGRQP